MAARPLPALARRFPWPVRALIGVVAAAIGLFLITSPLDSLTAIALYVGVSCLVVGIGTAAGALEDRRAGLLGLAWMGLGTVVLVLPGHAISALPTVLAIALIVSGVLRLLKVRSGAFDGRLANLMFGLTEIALGVVALSWNDVTLVVVAALFGISAVVFGLSLLAEALLRRDRRRDGEPTERGLVRRWGRVLAAGVALALSLGVLAVSGGLKDGAPKLDDFYTAPKNVPAEPGRLLRSEPFTREIPDGATGTRILYTTTDALGKRTVASGIVVVPNGSKAHPVIAWAHGTTGYARQCAPSALKEPFTAGAFPAVMGQVVSRGWAVVATDYAGLGPKGPQPYLIGKGAARSVLDAVRAARSLTDARLSAKTVVWGHSQGGGAALWADQEQSAYAPDVPLAGTVAMAPAADPLALARNLDNVTGGTVFGSFVYNAYADTYPDLELADFIKPSAVQLVRKIGSRCLAEPGVLASVLTALAIRDQDVLKVDPATGVVGDHLRANIPRNPGPGPLLIAQGLADGLVIPQVTSAYVARLRRDGHQVDYRTYAGLDHMPLVEDGSDLLPDLISWTAARFEDR